MSGTAVFRQEQSYMPLKLKAVMRKHRVTGLAICKEVLQMNGVRLSEPALNLLLNWGTWPAKTPQDSIRKQIESALLKRGVPQTELATIWEFDDPGAAPRGNTHKVSPTVAKHQAEEHQLRQLLEPEMLTQEAKVHFELPTTPFHNDVNGVDEVFMTKEMRAAHQALYYTAKHAGITAFVAESGGGKSTIRRLLEAKIVEREEPIRLLQPDVPDKKRMTSGHVAEAVIGALAPHQTIPNSLERRARLMRQLLTSSKEAGNSIALVIEEAHDLPIDMFSQLKRMWQIEKGFVNLLGVILIGQPELKKKLDARAYPSIREFINRCEMFEMSPLGPDLESYVEFKFKRIGVPLGRIFAKDAIDAIQVVLVGNGNTGAYPMNVNNLVTKSMNLCAQLGVPKVSGEVIRKVLAR